MVTSVGLVGFGEVGRKAARALELHAEYELLFVCDRSSERRNQSPSPAYPTLKAALDAHAKIDMVQIATPPASHHRLAMTALKAGTDVYIEKVMTLETDAATELLELADDSGAEVYVRRNSLYTPAFRRLFNAASSIGSVRRVSFVNATSAYETYPPEKTRWLRELPGGVVSEHLPHALYVVRHLLGGEPEKVTAQHDGETLAVRLGYSDRVGTITFVPPGRVAKTIRVVGTESSVLLNEDTRQLTRLETSGIRNPKTRIAIDTCRDITRSVRQGVSVASGHFLKHIRNFVGGTEGYLEHNTHYRQLEHIHAGDTAAFDGEEGLRNVKAFETVWSDVNE